MENKKKNMRQLPPNGGCIGSPQIGYLMKIEIDKKCYTIQTEDSGHAKAKIETSIFLGGAIIGTKCNSYQQHLGLDDVEKRICKMMSIQHLKMVNKLRNGTFVDKVISPVRVVASDTIKPIGRSNVLKLPVANEDHSKSKDQNSGAWDLAVARIYEEKVQLKNNASSQSSTPETPTAYPVNISANLVTPGERAIIEFERGMNLIQLKQYSAALEAWKEALSLDPNNRKYQINFKRLSQKIDDINNFKIA